MEYVTGKESRNRIPEAMMRESGAKTWMKELFSEGKYFFRNCSAKANAPQTKRNDTNSMAKNVGSTCPVTSLNGRKSNISGVIPK